MMVMAFVMRPWIKIMRALGVKPRVLADDIMVIAVGDNHNRNFTEAYDTTHQYVQDMGGRIAPNKSHTFSSCQATRRWLERHKWRRLHTKVPVCSSFRDLGAHLSTSKRMEAQTLTRRIQKATKTVRRLQRVNVTLSLIHI